MYSLRRPNAPAIVQNMYQHGPKQLLDALQKEFPRSHSTRDGHIRVLRGDNSLPDKVKAKKDETEDDNKQRLAKARDQSLKSRDHDDHEIDIQIKVGDSFGYLVYTLEAVMRVSSVDKTTNLVERYDGIVPDIAFVVQCVNNCETRVEAMHKKLSPHMTKRAQTVRAPIRFRK